MVSHGNIQFSNVAALKFYCYIYRVCQ